MNFFVRLFIEHHIENKCLFTLNLQIKLTRESPKLNIFIMNIFINFPIISHFYLAHCENHFMSKQIVLMMPINFNINTSTDKITSLGEKSQGEGKIASVLFMTGNSRLPLEDSRLSFLLNIFRY